SYLHNPGSEPLTIATLGEVLAESANKYPNRIAIRSIHEDITLTYEELLTQADSLGCTLRANGFNKGDRLGIWSHNMAGWILTVLAAARVGLISVFINPVYEKSELSFCLKKTGMKGLIIGNSLSNRDYYNSLKHLIPELDGCKPGSLISEQFPDLTTIISLEKEKLDGVFTFDSLLGNKTNQVSKYGSEIKPEDGSIIHFTSGTTGDVNVVYLDWAEEASKESIGTVLGYLKAASNTQNIGARFAAALLNLLDGGLEFTKVHLVGHSLGAQIAGITGNTLVAQGYILQRASCLDPAGPLYSGLISFKNGVSPECAKQVDVIHTDPGGYGIADRAGTADFWPNYEGGKTVQPGCLRGNFPLLSEEGNNNALFKKKQKPFLPTTSHACNLEG
ncbi:Acyl-CoA synthetase family member 2, mitochondrial, partial [Papilio xuthus]